MIHSLLSGIFLLHESPPQVEGGSLHPHETQLLYHYVNHGMQGYLRSGTWITSCTSFPTYLGVCCMALLTYSHSAVFWPQLHMSNSIFFPFLNILYRSVAVIPDWLSLTQQQVCPRAKWSWGNKLLAASHRNHPGAQFCHYQNHTNLSCQYSWILHSIADFKNSDLCRLSNSCLGCNNA